MTWADTLLSQARALFPGAVLCITAAIAAAFLSAHYGAPAMLLALLIGLALRSGTEGADKLTPGIAFSARNALRLGVGLLGARISMEVLFALGTGAVLLAVTAIAATLAFSFILARLVGWGWRFAILSGGAVAICGASAAVAIAATLPRNEVSDRNLTFTVFAVTILSTLAMIAYPIIGAAIGLSDAQMSLFLGATIHDVAQVVGAGFSVSDEVGEAATTMKLIRVAMLGPFVMILAITMSLLPVGRSETGERPSFMPWFVVLFGVLAAASSLHLLPEALQTALWHAARWLLLAAIVAVGLKTDLRGLVKMPLPAMIMIVSQTTFIALLALVWIA